MLKIILGLLSRSRGVQKEKTVRRWTEREPDRVRTFEETHQVSSSGMVSVSVDSIRELTTSRQMEFLQRLGFSGEGLDKSEAGLLLTRILRPVDYALKQTFKNLDATMDKESLCTLQVALARWDYCPSLPRFGPNATWPELEASGNDPQRSLTKEEKIAVTDVASRILSPEVFLALKSNGIKKYKDELDARGRRARRITV